MLRRIYNALWYPALPVALMLGGGVRRDDRDQRLARNIAADGRLAAAPLRIWMHAASVGEVEGIRPIAAGLLRKSPGTALIVTTMTAAGREAARRRIAAADWRLAPFDCAPIVRRFIARVRPDLVLVAETELWPNYFLEAHRAGARIAIVNGRISERSLTRYLQVQHLWAETLACVDKILAQSEADARRFETLGAPPDRIVITGSSKLDCPVEAAAEVRPQLAAFLANRPVMIAGSTAPGEDEIVLDAARQLLQDFPDLALVIAPRHLERIAEVAKVIRAANLNLVLGTSLLQNKTSGAPVMLLDTMGDLRGLYRLGTVAFVGGSLVEGRGGQNLAEPAACGVPVIFGPFHQNQMETAQALLAMAGGFVVRNADELARIAKRFLSDAVARHKAGENARKALERLGGATRATLLELESLIKLPQR